MQSNNFAKDEYLKDYGVKNRNNSEITEAK